jgi:chaperone modulatory protein CbpM
MMRVTAVVALFPDLRESELLSWVDRGWVRPEGDEPDFVFQEIDVARVRLIP